MDPIMAERNKQVILSLFELALQGHVTNALDLVADDYLEHSLVIPAGKEGLAEFLRSLTSREPAPQVILHRVVADDEHVVVHYHSATGPDKPGSAVADIFRLRDGSIVEHWDVVQPLLEAVPSGNPAF